MNAGSVIFLKPEIDKSMLQQESEEGEGGATDSIFQSLNSQNSGHNGTEESKSSAKTSATTSKKHHSAKKQRGQHSQGLTIEEPETMVSD